MISPELACPVRSVAIAAHAMKEQGSYVRHQIVHALTVAQRNAEGSLRRQGMTLKPPDGFRH